MNYELYLGVLPIDTWRHKRRLNKSRGRHRQIRGLRFRAGWDQLVLAATAVGLRVRSRAAVLGVVEVPRAFSRGL
eukprot:scaffold20174_cov42-Phaeocystis_antarctica.AAC.3